MKKFRRVLGLLLALVMAMSMGISAMADDTKVTITIDDGSVTGAHYAAYKLMDVTVGKDAKGETTYSYTVNSKYSSILQTASGKTTDADVITYISGLTDENEMIAFAKKVYEAILKDTSISPDYTTTSNTFEVELGYYMIAETKTGTNSSGTSNEVYSLVMVRTADQNITVNTKESVPTLVKKVYEVNDSVYNSNGGTWQDAADYDLGDDVPFRLTATLPSSTQYAVYDSYQLVFHDKLSSGLSFNNDVKVYVENSSGGQTTKTELSSSYYTVTTQTAGTCTYGSGCSFEVTLTNLKADTYLQNLITASSTIVVEYTAELTDSAVIGAAGNPNEAYLEYSNNPYGSGTGVTPEDKVTVFTFELDVTKVESRNHEEITGAGFTLYKWNATSASSGGWVAVGSEVKGTSITKFTWARLDSGLYKLEETTVPDGYTKADDIYFTVTATYDTTSNDPALTGLNVQVTSGSGNLVSNDASAEYSTGLITMSVVNKVGGLMPSTGGIGTTIFYIVGSILALGAAVLLVTKRRMGRAQ